MEDIFPVRRGSPSICFGLDIFCALFYVSDWRARASFPIVRPFRPLISSALCAIPHRAQLSTVRHGVGGGGKEKKKIHQPIIIIRGRTTQRISIDNKLKPPFHLCSYLFLAASCCVCVCVSVGFDGKKKSHLSISIRLHWLVSPPFPVLGEADYMGLYSSSLFLFARCINGLRMAKYTVINGSNLPPLSHTHTHTQRSRERERKI